jgi:hypothetical protein
MEKDEQDKKRGDRGSWGGIRKQVERVRRRKRIEVKSYLAQTMRRQQGRGREAKQSKAWDFRDPGAEVEPEP